MALIFEKIEIRNFISFGNVPQEFNLSDKKFKLIIGFNRDKGDNTANRSGVGKSSIVQAIHFALFGKSVDNRINLPKLVNSINGKNCEVKLYFNKDGKKYIIHRGRLPQFLKFYIDGQELTDMAQGNNRDTQEEINRILGFNEEIYNQIFSLSPIVENFLDQPLQKQRQIIESVLGVNQLTEKADKLRERIKEHKQNIKNEQFVLEKIKNTNNALIANFNQQKEQIKKSYNQWEQTNSKKIAELKNKISELLKIDIEQEKKNFQQLQEYNRIIDSNNKKKNMVVDIVKEVQVKQTDINTIKETIEKLSAINIEEEERIHEYNNKLAQEEMIYKTALTEHKQNEVKLKSIDRELVSLADKIKKIDADIANMEKNICPTCGQEIGKEESAKMVEQKANDKKVLQESYHKADLEHMELYHEVNQFQVKNFEYKTGYYKNYQDMVQHKFNLEKLNNDLNRLNNEVIQLLTKAQSPDYKPEPEIERPNLHYKTEKEIIEHNLKLEQYNAELNRLESDDNVNPYKIQLDNLSNPPLTEIDETQIIQMEKELAHEDILLKLLSSPDSYIRKTIIDTNLNFLNERIKFYLSKLGSLHSVVFNNDMSISVTKGGIEYGYLSTGENSSVAFALIFAFRELWEQLNFPVNLLYIDEKLDRSGLDSNQIEFLFSLLKEYSTKNDKNMCLVTHREELIQNNMDDLFIVTMENGFTSLDGN